MMRKGGKRTEISGSDMVTVQNTLHYAPTAAGRSDRESRERTDAADRWANGRMSSTKVLHTLVKAT